MSKHRLYDIERAVALIVDELKDKLPDQLMDFARFDTLATRLERMASDTSKAAAGIDAWAKIARDGG